MPIVSVIVPCHNGAPWLQAAINSLRQQTIRDIEIIIYNDGSTDGSEEIIQTLASQDSRIVVTGDRSNKGIVCALNAMLKIARGQYIARMDADDISLPRRLERQIAFINAGEADLCGTWFQEFGNGAPRVARWYCGMEELRAAMLFQNSICHPTVMARREVYEEFSYRNDFNLAEDYDFFVRAATKFRLGNVPEVLFRYRRHGQQVTRAKRFEMEGVTKRIRIEALKAQGIDPTLEEQTAHNKIRAPQSIRSIDDFDRIETWLLKLMALSENVDAKKIVAGQWVRAAVRAAPLGMAMWHKFRRSPLYHQLSASRFRDIDLLILATMRIEYGSRYFEFMRSFRLSA